MKKIIYLILIIFLVSFVSAEKYSQGQTIDVSGHKVTIHQIGQSSVIFNVDGVKNIATLYTEKEINGVKIIVTDIFYTDEIEFRTAEVSFSAITTGSGAVIGSCGDGTCDSNETKTSCCSDCGCETGYSCVNDKCEKNECNDNEYCWSNVTNRDFCKSYKCEGKPKKCVTSPISSCVINDKCCPSSCYYPDDPDCDKSKTNPNPSAKTPSIKENTTNQSEVVIVEQKPGLFQKFINWVISIFR